MIQRGFLCLLLGLLVAGIAAGSVEAAPPKNDPWPELLAGYRRYGLPFPPASAPLVTVRTNSYALPGGKREYAYTLGFALQPETKTQPATLLVGTESYRPNRVGQTAVVKGVVKPEANLIDQLDRSGRCLEPFEGNDLLATAIQCRERGWNALADRLLDRALKYAVGDPLSWWYQRAGTSPKVALGCLAMSHWAQELIRPDCDRALIARRMEALFQEIPELDSPDGRELLASIRATMAPRKPAANEVEAAIDAWLDLTYPAGWWWVDIPGWGNPPDERCRRVAMLGFAAVPALIEHLDDARLTRIAAMPIGRQAPYHVRIGDIASQILWNFTGEEVKTGYPPGWKGNISSRPVIVYADRPALLAWWKEARELGEEEYLVRHVLPKEDGGWSPQPLMLDILAARYPSHLGPIYQTILNKRPRLSSNSVVAAIVESTLSLEEKRALLRAPAVGGNPDHRLPAQWGLAALDRQTSPPPTEHPVVSAPEAPRTASTPAVKPARGKVTPAGKLRPR